MTPYRALFAVFGRIGLLSFGGPAAQIALMHKELVEDRNWLSEAEFLKALSFCMLLPGPEAMQLATYAGWKKRGITGGLIAGLLFVLPGAAVIAALVWGYLAYGDVPWVQAAFLGIKAAVTVIVLAALIKIGQRALSGPLHLWLAVGAFVALFFFALSFPLVILSAAIIGAVSAPPDASPAPPAPRRFAASLRVILLGGALWAAPLLLVAATEQAFLLQLGLFFSTLAVVTFGGAYAVLAYMTQEVVTQFGWISTAQMIDALGLAETTPGPLILVTQFVGMLAGAAQGGPVMAILAGLMTLWVTFVPCFIWIFAGAPLIDWLDTQPRLRAALAAVTAAVVGVIANLSLWFTLHVLFERTALFEWGPVQAVMPQITSINTTAVALTAFSALLVFGLRWSLPVVLAVAGFAGILLTGFSA